MTFREEKRQAREDLHKALSEPVLYFQRRAVARKTVTARLHLRFDALGDIRSGGFADWNEMVPKIIFWLSEVRPLRDGLVVTKDIGVFRVNDVESPDDVTITARVVHLPDAEVRQLGWKPELPWCGEIPPEI